MTPEQEIPKLKTEVAQMPLQNELVKKMNEILLKSGFRSIDEVIVLITKVEESKFNEDDLNVLADVWSPFVPTLPPTYYAMLTTFILYAKKLSIIINAKRISKIEEKTENQIGLIG
jgi:hypothetical protein